ncbi:MAG: hypothetical protein H7Z40_00305, partial [Phycisphaerae bacterium]|nr:hypothetical protein [Gemmatimonadaceae bacterium]
MSHPKVTWYRAVATESEPTTLSARAARRLEDGPLDSVTLMREVCHVERLTAEAGERMAMALLGGREEFVRLSNGTWSLRDDSRLRANVEGAPRVVAENDPLLSSLSFAVVDVETTGTSARTYDRITEISVVRVVEGEIADVYTRLVNPERSIPPFITSLTQISWDMVKDELPFRGIAEEVAERLTGHVFAAHNAVFDWGF